MEYKEFRQEYQKLYAASPFTAFLYWQQYATAFQDLPVRLDTIAALAVYENDAVISMLQEGA